MGRKRVHAGPSPAEEEAARCLSGFFGSHPWPLRAVTEGALPPPPGLAPGQWLRASAAARRWARENPGRWEMVAEYCVFARPNRSRLDGSMLEKTARRCGVSRSTVLRAFKRFVMLLAQAAAEEPGEP